MKRVDFNSVSLVRCGAALLIASVLFLLSQNACRPKRPRRDQPQQPTDGRVIEGGKDWKDNPEVVSPLILREPLYDCTKVVWVSGFILGAEITIFEGSNPIGTSVGHFPEGEQFPVSISFVKGQVITAKQKFQGVTGGPSNAVTVRGVHDDYPGGVPTPNVIPPPLFDCGLATSANSFIPGADLTVQSEPSTGGGTFGPGVNIGGGPAAAPWPHWWTGVSPAFKRDARVTISYKVCDLTSPRSPGLIVQPQPSAIPKPTVQNNVYEGGRIVVVEGGLNGSRLRVSSGATQIGDSATPGGAPQQIWIDPAATSGASLTATQSLCDTSPPSDSVPVQPCSALPAAIAKQPQPGDDRIELITYVPGARIVVLAGGVEIGDGGAPVVMLTRPLNNGEDITIIQILGECRSRWVHVITVRCPFGTDPKACSADWPMFRQNTGRNAQQSKNSLLANPDLVRLLKVKSPWPFRPSGSVGFRASPVVFNGKVYIGNQNGRFYAVDATTGAQLWQYPAAAQPALTSTFISNASSIGIASSATIATIPKAQGGKDLNVVIFGAPDRSIGAGLGSGRLFALNADTGAEVWKSPEVAVLEASPSQRHEQIGYSSPLVVNDRVYIGIADHGDNPIQNGKVVAVKLSDGTIDGAFNYQSTSTRGGGVWSSVAGGPNGELYITTGNAKCWNGGCQGEPRVDNSLSLLRLDPATGAVIWKLKPVPFDLDGDPDWASGAAFEPTACGPRIVSTMKDGWSYAVRPGDGTPGAAPVEWQFPNNTIPFTSGDGTVHGDTRYLRPGAAWESVFITTSGGLRVRDDVTEGYTRLQGFNICADRTNRVRWILDVPNTSPVGDDRYRLGAPTVTKGIVFVTTSEGHLIVFADQNAYYPAGFRCSNWNVSNGDCVANGFQLVAQPAILANITLDGSQTLTEPALAGNRVYVATGSGNLYMLEP